MTQNATGNSSEEENTTAANTEQIPEYSILKDNIDMSAYKLDVKEDDPCKRIVILKNQQGEGKYKSIFIKKTGRMKLIEFDNGLLFNQVYE
ncbi:hypothetical protein KK120_07855 [Virgibacillus dakarensis]|nr:hypothetical protein [Virgibacillus dakarensis]